MKKNQNNQLKENSFYYRKTYHFEEGGKYFSLLYGTKKNSISKKEFEKRQKKQDGT